VLGDVDCATNGVLAEGNALGRLDVAHVGLPGMTLGGAVWDERSARTVLGDVTAQLAVWLLRGVHWAVSK
jgi:hypothetical protein